MLSRFFKPKWQHADPNVRIKAIATLNDNKTLAQIAAQDSDAVVRQAAVQRIDSMGQLLTIPATPGLDDSLHQRFCQLLPKTIQTLNDNDAVQQQVRQITQTSLLELIVQQSPQVSLRRIAINKLQDQDTLAQCAIDDASAEIRHIAASRLSDETQIRSTLRKLGKRDKRASQILRDTIARLQAQQALEIQLDQMIDSLAELGNSGEWQRDKTSLEALKNRWQTIDTDNEIPASHKTRFETATKAAEQRIAEKQQQADALKPIIEAKQTLNTQATELLAQLNARFRVSQDEAAEFTHQLDDLQKQWEAHKILPEQQEVPLANPFFATLHKSRDQIQHLRANAQKTSHLDRLINAAERQLKHKHVKTRAVAKLEEDWRSEKKPTDSQLASDYQHQFNSLLDKLKSRLAQQAKHREKSLQDIHQWLALIEQHIHNDQLGDSAKLLHQIQHTMDSLVEIPAQEKQAINDQLHALSPRIRELDGWRHWGTERARETLIQEAKNLKDQQHSVEERAKAVQDLRNRWKKLGKIDPVVGRRLWQEFDRHCSDAYALCQSHYKAEAEQRENNLKQRQALIEEIEAITQSTDWDNADWRTIDKTFSQLQKRWRNCGSVNRKEWQQIQSRYKQAMAAMDSKLDGERKTNFQQRQHLVEQLENEYDNDDLNSALQTARNAQKQWQPTVTSRRGEEQKLWKRFRAAIDAIFEREKERREGISEDNRAKLEEKESICAAIEDLVNNAANNPDDIAKLKAQWQHIGEIHGERDRKITRRYNKALEGFRQLQHQQTQQVIHNQFKAMLAKHALILSLEAAMQQADTAASLPEIEIQWQALESTGNSKLDDALHARYQQALQGDIDEQQLIQNNKTQTQLLLDLEILLEIESPADQAEQRLQRQVERLAHAFSSSSSLDRQQQSITLAGDYCACGPVTHDNAERNQQRFEKISQQIEKIF